MAASSSAPRAAPLLGAAAAAAAAPPEEEPGAAFMLSRLARAQAVPEEERSKEVQAFIDGVALLRQASKWEQGPCVHCNALRNSQGAPRLP